MQTKPTITDFWTIEETSMTAHFELRGHVPEQQRAAAADRWAAAAGAAGAYAPPHIARELIDTDDLIEAVRAGTRAAQEQHDAESLSPSDPRGCEVEIVAGEGRAIVWRSETHVCRMDRTSWGWRVEIATTDGSPILRSLRAWAALVATPVDLEFIHDDGRKALVARDPRVEAYTVPAVVDGVALYQMVGIGAIAA